ncbi:MAG: hypothetical protein CME65_03625 [Halobacteriovoraceae bacterium]|nr:hypothetical protein [Halobacteriovoraceae bacterium]|tara:strand:+ start:2880 stop:3584 length:705 start_codon:yes stop_codon:yes gene_type:complete
MIITIDIGNSHQNYALFKDNELFVEKGDFQDLDIVLKKYPESRVIVSSVDDEFLNQIPGEFTLIRKFFGKGAFLDMPISYSKTIGEDRLATSYYLYKLNQQSKAIVDSGTFTTIDFLSSKGHLGGYILPGSRPLRGSFGHGRKLKEVPLNNNLEFKNELPQSTPEAMEQGLLAATLFPIEGLLKLHNIENIFITGGDGEAVAKHLKNSKSDFKLAYSAELIHRSLCFIAKRMKP